MQELLRCLDSGADGSPAGLAVAVGRKPAGGLGASCSPAPGSPVAAGSPRVVSGFTVSLGSSAISSPTAGGTLHRVPSGLSRTLSSSGLAEEAQAAAASEPVAREPPIAEPAEADADEVNHYQPADQPADGGSCAVLVLARRGAALDALGSLPSTPTRTASPVPIPWSSALAPRPVHPRQRRDADPVSLSPLNPARVSPDASPGCPVLARSPLRLPRSPGELSRMLLGSFENSLVYSASRRRRRRRRPEARRCSLPGRQPAQNTPSSTPPPLPPTGRPACSCIRVPGWYAVLMVHPRGPVPGRAPAKRRLPFVAECLTPPGGGPALPYCASIALDASGSPTADGPPGKGERVRVPPAGEVVLVVGNPEGTPVCTFRVPYDLSNMPGGCKTYVRQRILSSSRSAEPGRGGSLRYALQLRFVTPPASHPPRGAEGAERSPQPPGGAEQSPGSEGSSPSPSSAPARHKLFLQARRRAAPPPCPSLRLRPQRHPACAQGDVRVVFPPRRPDADLEELTTETSRPEEFFPTG